MSLLSVCQDGYSISDTVIPGLDTGAVLARINEYEPAAIIDTTSRGEILKTVFNVGLEKAAEKPLWIVPNSMRYRRYSRLETGDKELLASQVGLSENTLHRQFAGLAQKSNMDILKFANKYGMLKRHQVHNMVFQNPNTGKQLQLGESLLWWKQEIRELAEAVELWDMVLRNDGGLKNVVLWHRDGITIRLGDNDVPMINRANIHLLNRWSKGDVKEPALLYISVEADKRLPNTLTPVVLPFKNCEICFLPDTLLAMIWMMFLCEISGSTRLIVRCASCDEYFYTQDPRAKFCSTRCRMRNYRKLMTHKSKGREEIKEGKEI